MWIQVRSFDGKKTIRVIDLSKLTKVEELREKLIEPFDAPPERQRLFYRGKQLEDGNSLFDYDVGLNDLIQIMVRQPPKVDENRNVTPQKSEPNEASSGYGSSNEDNASDKENETPNTKNQKDEVAKDEPTSAQTDTKEVDTKEDSTKEVEMKEVEPDTSQATTSSEAIEVDTTGSEYRIKDIIDARDVTMGAWFEATIMKVIPTEEGSEEKWKYLVTYEGYDEDDPVEILAKHIRPRARHLIKFSDVAKGQKVMINYNYDSPNDRGYWYDAEISDKRDTRTLKELYGTVYIGADLTPLENCKLTFVHEVFEIETQGSQLNEEDVLNKTVESPVKRQNKPECDHCLDKPNKKCKFCACSVCGGKNDPDKQILCDECDQAYHLGCLDPPLDSIPTSDEWYCPLCKNDKTEVVGAGQQLKASKKKSKMASATSTSSRDWGKGMACVGRTKHCNIVPNTHFGPIPGVEIGTLWKFRVQVSEAGVHRPHVAGIHGQGEAGAYSIVLSGGYEDDKDDGEEFTYTGSGGRDLSGNKRTAEQSCDQQLTRTNRALAKNCNAPLDNKNGATAKNWKDGKPVRVVRNCKGRKHSEYAPEEGNRYDGIYKVVSYWPEKGKSGFLVWRYLFRRDDENPAPWTKAGRKHSKKMGLEMQYPEGYLEAQESKEREKEEQEAAKEGKKGRGKRKLEDDDESSSTPAKKSKTKSNSVDKDILKLIELDTDNKKLWQEALETVEKEGKKLHAVVEEVFMCICCQDVVYKSVTTSCNHNVCSLCLSRVRSFKAEVYTCPACRADLGRDYSMAHDMPLHNIASPSTVVLVTVIQGGSVHVPTVQHVGQT